MGAVHETTELDSSRVKSCSVTLSEFPFADEDLVRAQASKFQEVDLSKCELSQELYMKTSLMDLKKETIRWHQAGNQVEEDLNTLDTVTEGLRGKMQREETTEDTTLVDDGALRGRSLSQVFKVVTVNRGRRCSVSPIFRNTPAQMMPRCHPLWEVSRSYRETTC